MLCWSLTLVYLSHKNICALHHEKKSHNVDLFLDNKSSSTLNHFVFSTMKQSNIFKLYPYIQRIRVVIHRKEFTLELVSDMNETWYLWPYILAIIIVYPFLYFSLFPKALFSFFRCISFSHKKESIVLIWRGDDYGFSRHFWSAFWTQTESKMQDNTCAAMHVYASGK